MRSTASPARQIVASSDIATTTTVAIECMAGQGFVVRSAPGALPVVLEYGTAMTGLLGGLGLGILPGKVGKHGFAVVDASEEAGATTLTVAHVLGCRVNVPVLAAIAEITASLRGAGALVDAGVPLSATDLPLDSPGHPHTFTRLGYVSVAGRWLTT